MIKGYSVLFLFLNSFLFFGQINTDASKSRLLKLESMSLQDSINQYNYIIGTQQIGGYYSFGDATRIVNAAQAILELGSNTMKMALTSRYHKHNGVPVRKKIKALSDLIKYEPSIKEVFDMPFSNYLLWTYPFQSQNSGLWGKEGTYSEEDKGIEYQEMYDFTAYLLKQYAGSGKTFYLGNWEGDWHLFPDKKLNLPPSEGRVKAMAEWLNVRQAAVDKAKKDIGEHGVKVFFYIEVNQGMLALNGKPCVVNSVFPLLKKSPDFISLSSYSIQKKDEETIHKVLDYLQGKLKPNDSIHGKRIIIGEYGFALGKRMTEIQQAELYRQTALKYLSWNPRFILSWQLYDNINRKITWPKHYNLINSNNEYTPLYYMHKNFLFEARNFVTEYSKNNDRLPNRIVYTDKAIEILKNVQF